MNKASLIGISILAVVLIVLGSQSTVVGYQTNDNLLQKGFKEKQEEGLRGRPYRVTGRVDGSAFFNPFFRPGLFLASFKIPYFHYSLVGRITFGYWYDNGVSWGGDNALGWVLVKTNQTTTNYTGSFSGTLKTIYQDGVGHMEYYVGIEGFQGIIFCRPVYPYTLYFIGSARNVGIGG
jgi:hypothetical protein